jgi:hypothetical protein
MPAPFPPGSGPGARASTTFAQPTDGGQSTGPVEAIHSVAFPRPSGTQGAAIVGFFDAGGRQCIASSFIASSLSPSIQQVSVAIQTASSLADTLVVGLYSDSGGTPGGLIDSTTVALAFTGAGQLFTFPSVNMLTGGSKYWIVLTTGSASNYITGQVSVRYARNTDGSHPSPSDTDTLIGANVGSLATWTQSAKIALLDFEPGSTGIAAGLGPGGALFGSGYDGQGHSGTWVGGGFVLTEPAPIGTTGTNVETGFMDSGEWKVARPYGVSANMSAPFLRLDSGGSDTGINAPFRAARRSDGSWVAMYYGGGFPYSIYVQTWSAGGGFSVAQLVGATGGLLGGGPKARILSLLIDSSDRAHLIWSESATGALFHRVLDTGSAIGTWEAGLITASEFTSNAGIGCAYNGGVVVPYLRNDGCFRMAFWPSDSTTTTPTIKALPQTISPAAVLTAGVSAFTGTNGPGCLAAYGDRLYCFHRVTSGALMGVATYDAGVWTGSVTTWNADVSAGAISAAYLPTKALMGVLFNQYFQYWDEPGGGYPAFTDYNCAPVVVRRARAYAQTIG